MLGSWLQTHLSYLLSDLRVNTRLRVAAIASVQRIYLLLPKRTVLHHSGREYKDYLGVLFVHQRSLHVRPEWYMVNTAGRAVSAAPSAGVATIW